MCVYYIVIYIYMYIVYMNRPYMPTASINLHAVENISFPLLGLRYQFPSPELASVNNFL